MAWCSQRVIVVEEAGIGGNGFIGYAVLLNLPVVMAATLTDR